MTSQLDLDQGGTAREWQRIFMGPSVGWVWMPVRNVLPITAAGTFSILPSTNLVTVNVAGSVFIVLPSIITPTIPAGASPGRFVLNPISVIDIGGNAQNFPISVQGASNSETIDGQLSILMSANFGGLTFTPAPSVPGWTA